MNESIIVSVKELAEKTGLSDQSCRGLLEFLVARGIAVQSGTRKTEGGRGKPSTLFTVPLGFKVDLLPNLAGVEVAKEAISELV